MDWCSLINSPDSRKKDRGGQLCTLWWYHVCLSLKIATRICQYSQYVGTKRDMLFDMAKSVEIVIILRKAAILP